MDSKPGEAGSNDTSQNRKTNKTAFWLVGLVGVMLGLAFASAPLYRIFCQVTGFDGTTQKAAAASNQIFDREIKIRFDTNVDPRLPFDFKVETKTITLKVGENGLVNFVAHNWSDQPVTAMATYGVTPEKAGIYFQKVQCFCFDQQTIGAGETVDMPMLFYLDPNLMDDKNMDGVKELTMSYTFFPYES